MAIIFTAVTHQVIDHWSDNTWMTWKNTLSCHVPQSAGITHTYYMISFAFTLLLLFFHNLPCHFYITSLFQTSIWRNNGQISREGIQAAVSKLIWQTFLTVSALQSVCPVRGCGAITESAQFTWWDVEHKHVLVIQKCLLALVKTVSVLLSDVNNSSGAGSGATWCQTHPTQTPRHSDASEALQRNRRSGNTHCEGLESNNESRGNEKGSPVQLVPLCVASSYFIISSGNQDKYGKKAG